MKKPSLRVTKWLGDIPIAGECTSCVAVAFDVKSASHRPIADVGPCPSRLRKSGIAGQGRPHRLKPVLIFNALRARLKAAPFQNKIKTRVFPQALGLVTSVTLPSTILSGYGFARAGQVIVGESGETQVFVPLLDRRL